jgi:kynureninase
MTTLQDCRALDAQDPLRSLRDLFTLPEGVIYLDGNSLGPLPTAAPERVARAVRDEWGQGLIRSWNTAGWYDMPRRLGDRIAPLIGAGPGEVVATDSTSINLFKVLSAALSLCAADAPARRTVISERSNSPPISTSPKAPVRRGLELQLLRAQRDPVPPLDERSGCLLHATSATHRRHARHARPHRAARGRARWSSDLAHSAVPSRSGPAWAPMRTSPSAVQGTNGGPGAPAFVWVHPSHADASGKPLPAGGATPRPLPSHPITSPRGIARTSGTQLILSMTALECGLDTLGAAEPLARGLRRCRKSLALTDLFIALVRSAAAATTRACDAAGARAARLQGALLTRWGAYAIVQALIARGVIGTTPRRPARHPALRLRPLYGGLRGRVARGGAPAPGAGHGGMAPARIQSTACGHMR